MKLLIIDHSGKALALAWRAVLAGHAVKWFIEPKDGNSKHAGDGFKGIEKVDNWVPAAAKWADLVVCTGNDNYLERLAFFRKQGVPVFGPTPASAKLELDRATGLSALAAAGVTPPPYKVFTTMAAAIKHVEQTAERFVFKTMGDNETKAVTYVSRSPADMLAWMHRTAPTVAGAVMLQQFIDGVEVSVSRFMGAAGWVGQYNERIECDSDHHGTVAYFTPESKLGAETLAKCERPLLDAGHTGAASIEFIVDAEGVCWPIKLKCRLGWPTTNLMLGATAGDPAAWMLDALRGKDTTTFREDIGCCLVLRQEREDATEGTPLYGLTKGNKKHVHPQSIKIEVLPDMDGDKVVHRPVWATAGGCAPAAVVTGFGRTVAQATSRAYGTVRQLYVSNMHVKAGVGDCLKLTLPTLHKLGYANHCEYEV